MTTAAPTPSTSHSFHSPSFDGLTDLPLEQQREWLDGFRSFFEDMDLSSAPDSGLWTEGWVDASEEALHILNTLLPHEIAVAPYGERGVGFGAWRDLFLEHGLIEALAATCAPAGAISINGKQ